MGQWIGKAIGTAKNKALKGSAKVAANQVIDLTGPVGIAINIGFAVIGFMNGWFNVKNILL